MQSSQLHVKQILHLDLKFETYKMKVVQELYTRYFLNRLLCHQRLLPENYVVFFSDEAHFHLLA